MSLRFIESFDHVAVGDLDKKWTSATGSQTIQAGRFGNCLRCDNNAQSVSKTIDSQAEWWVGGAFKADSTSVATLLGVRDSGTTQLDVRFAAGGFLQVTRNGTSLAIGTTVISINVWYYIELHALINNTTGAYELRINGVTEVSGSGVNTRASANNTANQIAYGGSANNNYYWDDIYICDAQGSTNNSFLGDVRVEALFPNGNGNSSQFDGSDGNTTDNYLLVDETAPNGDTDYVESPDVGDKDTYAYANLSAGSGTVYGVQTNMYARKTDAGTRSVKSVARLSGTETDGADTALSLTYLYYRDIRETKPGGGAWTVSDVNSAEFGVKVSA